MDEQKELSQEEELDLEQMDFSAPEGEVSEVQAVIEIIAKMASSLKMFIETSKISSLLKSYIPKLHYPLLHYGHA